MPPCKSMVGQRLRDIRRNSGLKTSAIAQKIDMYDYHTIFNMQTHNNFYGLITVAKLCKVYGITVEQLLKGLV